MSLYQSRDKNEIGSFVLKSSDMSDMEISSDAQYEIHFFCRNVERN